MLRVLLFAASLVLSSYSLAATVVCSNPDFGILAIEGSLNKCQVTLMPNEGTPWISATNSCAEIYDGATYKLSAEMYAGASLDTATVVIVRGTTSDIQSVKWIQGETVFQMGRHQLECKLQ
ncbi:hypothetical protein AZI86_17610 [Bdellovibrio bacteriovorus]|uniref:Uncharacterized protein n=1 Tax=Bdellovibrio bacteriovorus TaxID=959 RepID=A0A150WF41_BDEBC|nr:hypothetical protein [Bdellovibrio bacteriovorus]KYG61525.1 hypothetical protein AZI86_17610 [Bdellovibrio bacteriovorus]